MEFLNMISSVFQTEKLDGRSDNGLKEEQLQLEMLKTIGVF